MRIPSEKPFLKQPDKENIGTKSVSKSKGNSIPEDLSAEPQKPNEHEVHSSGKINSEPMDERKQNDYLSKVAKNSGMAALAKDGNEKQFHRIFGTTLGYDPKDISDENNEYQNAEKLRSALRDDDWESAGLRLATAKSGQLERPAAFQGGDM